MAITALFNSSVRHSPKYFPSMNSERRTGFDRMLAMAPLSISFETSPMPRKMAINTPKMVIADRLRSMMIFTSCPTAMRPTTTDAIISRMTNKTVLYRTRSRADSRNVLRAIGMIFKACKCTQTSVFLRDQVIDQIHGGRLGAELPDHPDDLAAMKRPVVDHMLHLFGERERERLTFDALVAQILMQSFLGQTFEQLAALVFDLPPARAQLLGAGEIIRRPDARMRYAFPSFEPDPFGAGHVD